MMSVLNFNSDSANLNSADKLFSLGGFQLIYQCFEGHSMTCK